MHYEELHWSMQASVPLLALIQLFPVLLAVIIFLARDKAGIFLIGIGGAFIEWVLTVILLVRFDQAHPIFQFAERIHLYGPFQYHAAVDGVGVLFALLTSFLTLMIILYGHTRGIQPRWRFLVLVCLEQATLMFQFFILDIVLFGWGSLLQMTIIGIMLYHWSTDNTRPIIHFAQFMAIGILLFFLGTTLLGWHHSQATGGLWSFDLMDLTRTPPDLHLQSIIFFLLFYGLAIRIPLFPMHGWLPDTAQHGMVAVAPVFLIGLKTGVFGILRFVFPLLPEAVVQWHKYVVTFAVIGIFYAAILALTQANIRRLLAYSVVSHTGIVTIGLFSLEHRAFEGAVLLSVNLGLAMAGMLFAAGFIHLRTRTMFMDRLGGLFDHFPIIGSTFLISGLSIVCMPGTPGFDAVHLVLEAAISRFGALVTILAALGNVVAAGFLLWAFHRTFLAKSQKDLKMDMAPPRLQERAIAVLTVSALLALGFYSEPWMLLIEKSLEGLGLMFEHALTLK
ncbi:MAG: NADH-quinone oxidoreductase subunit M [Magnetococcales bacterium]|nr:NADH-quinone oxidoreductase subunit M [Magnetococcales bacterium]MBF0148478.1 NADH-quinone oxidoreductase subunit M [Magnetococcales bacterium]